MSRGHTMFDYLISEPDIDRALCVFFVSRAALFARQLGKYVDTTKQDLADAVEVRRLITLVVSGRLPVIFVPYEDALMSYWEIEPREGWQDASRRRIEKSHVE